MTIQIGDYSSSAIDDCIVATARFGERASPGPGRRHSGKVCALVRVEPGAHPDVAVAIATVSDRSGMLRTGRARVADSARSILNATGLDPSTAEANMIQRGLQPLVP